MSIDLAYDGQVLTWNAPSDFAKFNASSGLVERKARMFRSDAYIYAFVEDYRCTWYEASKDRGPIPSGVYRVATKIPKQPYATFDVQTCGLSDNFSVQQIPRGGKITDHPTSSTAGECEPYWANWGFNRVALLPIGKNAAPHRSGFYLHDSSKGYTHGCVEVDQKFFTDKLLPVVQKHPGIEMRLTVKYSKVFHTYGSTFAKDPGAGGKGLNDALQQQSLASLKDLTDRLKAGAPLGGEASFAKNVHAHRVRLDPPPQDRLRLYDSSFNLNYGPNDVAGLSSTIVDQVPGWWDNFV